MQLLCENNEVKPKNVDLIEGKCSPLSNEMARFTSVNSRF